eukprot:2292824-Pleurochrysis_carterae.AAC.1
MAPPARVGPATATDRTAPTNGLEETTAAGATERTAPAERTAHARDARGPSRRGRTAPTRWTRRGDEGGGPATTPASRREGARAGGVLRRRASV